MTPQPASESGKLGEEELSPEHDELCSDEENDTIRDFELPSVSKVACHRCRKRKIKCDRHNPCNRCLRASSECSFPVPQKRAKRKVLISSLLVDCMSKKIDDLTQLIQRMDIPSNQRRPEPGGKHIQLYKASDSPRPTQSTGPDHEGIDNSLFEKALQVATLLEKDLNDQDTRDDSRITAEIQLSRQTLQAVLDSHTRRSTSHNEGPPFSKSLPPGMTFRDLPVPPIEKVMACLRMVQDRGNATVPWMGETKSFGDFTLTLVQVCSPGPVTEVELIISLSGLYWIFNECARWASPEAGNDLKDQARVCQNSLEVILSTLNFWLPTTVDTVLAMNLAALFCFQKGKVYACWTFINKAVMLAKALGLHMVGSASGLASEERHRQYCLFWSIYCLERSTALRLARPSAIHDQHVTIPSPDEYPMLQGLLSTRQSLIDGVRAARMYGRIYDDLFNPRALEQPAAHRATRGEAIATEWRAIIASREERMAQWDKDSHGKAGETIPVEFTRHATRATDYLLLTAIHRVALCTPLTSASAECTAAARISLREHTTCIALLAGYEDDSLVFELWTDGGLILFPFMPFNVVFCSVIETGSLADLESLKALVDALELLSHKTDYTRCARQLRIFRALYTVAVVHHEAQHQRHLGPHPPGATPSSSSHAVLKQFSSTMARPPLSTGFDGTLNEGPNLPPVPHVLEGHTWTDFGGMDLDPLGTHLGYWIHESNQAPDFFDGT